MFGIFAKLQWCDIKLKNLTTLKCSKNLCIVLILGVSLRVLVCRENTFYSSLSFLQLFELPLIDIDHWHNIWSRQFLYAHKIKLYFTGHQQRTFLLVSNKKEFFCFNHGYHLKCLEYQQKMQIHSSVYVHKNCEKTADWHEKPQNSKV